VTSATTEDKPEQDREPRPPDKDRSNDRVARVKTAATEFLKWLVFNLAIPSVAPFLVAIPIRVHEAGGLERGHDPLSFVGLPEVMVACGVMSWAAFRDTMDAAGWNERSRQNLWGLCTFFGVFDFGIAGLANKLTFANFGHAGTSAQAWILIFAAFTIVLSCCVSIGRGMRDED